MKGQKLIGCEKLIEVKLAILKSSLNRPQHPSCHKKVTGGSSEMSQTKGSGSEGSCDNVRQYDHLFPIFCLNPFDYISQHDRSFRNGELGVHKRFRYGDMLSEPLRTGRSQTGHSRSPIIAEQTVWSLMMKCQEIKRLIWNNPGYL